MRRVLIAASTLSLLVLAGAAAAQSPPASATSSQATGSGKEQAVQPDGIDPAHTNSTKEVPDAAKSTPPNPCDPAQAKAGHGHANQNNASGGCSN